MRVRMGEELDISCFMNLRPVSRCNQLDERSWRENFNDGVAGDCGRAYIPVK